MATNNSVNNGLSGVTGSGTFVGSTSPTLVTPLLGTPTSGTLTNCTGLVPSTGLSSVTGTGAAVLAGSPVLTAGMTIGAGITFPAAAVPSANANTLDDYEEGTFTPEFADAVSGGNTATASSRTGEYTKIGNRVFLTISALLLNTAGMTAGNTFYIRNLPFTAAAASATKTATPFLTAFTVSSNYVSARINASTSSIILVDIPATTNILVSDISSGSGVIYLNINYIV